MNESNVATTGGTLRRTLAMTHTQFTKNSYACLSPVGYGERGEGAVGGTAAPTLRMSENQNAQNKFKAKKLTLTE